MKHKILAVQQALRSGSHAALITTDTNRRYISGFSSSAGVLVVTKDMGYLFIDSRYYEKAKDTAENRYLQVVLLKDMRLQLLDIFSSCGIRTVSVENQGMTVYELSEYKTLFTDLSFDDSSFLSDLLKKQRAIKTPDEVEKIRVAQKIAEKAFDRLIMKLRPGITEKQAAALLNFYMMDYGADGISFDTIAASGKNSAVPHAVPTDKRLENGDFLTLDFGAVYDGYHSDMTRTVVIGKPTENMIQVYDAVKNANLDALKAVRSEISAKLLDNVARSTLEAWGYGEYFGHGLGHGVGLDIHEFPSVSPKSDVSLRPGMVITIEPGVYIPHSYGVRIEDMVLVTEDGCQNLTSTQKNLIYI